MRRVVVVSDVQVPYGNRRQVNSLARFIKDFKPDAVYCVGDVADLPMVSRWTRGRKGEHAGDIVQHLDEVKRTLEKLQVTDLKEGNHDRRVETYIDTYAPALSPLHELKMESLLGLKDLGITLHRQLWEFTPGWVLAHGDEGTLSQTGGMTAMNLANKIQKSVVCSHTHRQGIVAQGSSLLGIEGNTLFGVEVGHMMNLADAQYLRSGMANWTAGFGVLDISNKKVQPHLVQMSPTGSFFWEGKPYEDGVVRIKSTKGAA